MKAVVAFHGRGAGLMPALFGRPGFRHCFVAVASGPYWIAVDARNGSPVVEVVAGANFDLARFYRDQGFTVAETVTRGAPTAWPWMCATCVGAVKKVLGVRAWWVQTPWRLYRHLRTKG